MSVSLCVQHCPKAEAHDDLKKEKQTNTDCREDGCEHLNRLYTGCKMAVLGKTQKSDRITLIPTTQMTTCQHSLSFHIQVG